MTLTTSSRPADPVTPVKGTAPSARFVYEPPPMYPKQRAAFFNKARYAICEASTKSGKTVGCMVWLAEQAMRGKPGQNFFWVAPIYPQAKIAFRRLKRGLPARLVKSNESELTLTLANGTVIWFKGADKPDSLYGEDVYAAVIDEASRCKDEAWHAIRSTLTQTQGPIRIIGNVKGRKNWAYQLARKAQSGEPNMHYAKITAYDAVEGGVLDAAEIEDAKRTLPESVFKELYLAEAADDQGNPFGPDAIRACVGALSLEPVEAWGWDLAKSHDWTVGFGLDSEGRTAQFERWQAPWEVTTERIIQITGSEPALVDSTGVGDPILERLQKGRSNYSGYVFSPLSKQKLMEGLAAAIQHREVSYPDGSPAFPGVVVDELESFEYVYTRTGVRYSAPEGAWDDCVCSLALAVQARATMPRGSIFFA